MAMPYSETGRTRQKSRTRTALLDAARALLAEGKTPRVEDTAERSGISRTTAYRYFPNQRSLLLAAQPEIQPDTLLGDDAPSDPRQRLEAFMKAFAAYNLEWEPQLRAALRLSLEPGSTEKPVLRRGRAIGWVEDALEPLRHSHPQLDRRRLAVAIRSATGIEALIWLRDIAGQSPRQAAQTVRQSALALLDAALFEAEGRRDGPMRGTSQRPLRLAGGSET